MRYTMTLQNSSGFPFLLVVFFTSILAVVFGFFLRGIFSFFLQDSTFVLIQLIDWFLVIGLFGLFFSMLGVVSGGLFFLYKLRQLVKRSRENGFESNDFEYRIKFRRIPHDET